MKTYKEFEDGLSDKQKEKARELYDSVKIDGPPLPCYSDKPTDSQYFKTIELTPEQEAEVQKAYEEGSEKYKSIAHIICEQELPVEYQEMFDKELEEDDESTNYTKEQAS